MPLECAVAPPDPRSAFSSCSGHDQIRHEDLSLGLRSEQQRNDKARRSDAGADQHRDRKAETVMAGEPGQDERDKAAEYRPLVIAEGARRRADFGREALRKIGGGLAGDRPARKALAAKSERGTREGGG